MSVVRNEEEGRACPHRRLRLDTNVSPASCSKYWSSFYMKDMKDMKDIRICGAKVFGVGVFILFVCVFCLCVCVCVCVCACL